MTVPLARFPQAETSSVRASSLVFGLRALRFDDKGRGPSFGLGLKKKASSSIGQVLDRRDGFPSPVLVQNVSRKTFVQTFVLGSGALLTSGLSSELRGQSTEEAAIELKSDAFSFSVRVVLGAEPT